MGLDEVKVQRNVIDTAKKLRTLSNRLSAAFFWLAAERASESDIAALLNSTSYIFTKENWSVR